MTEAPTKRGPSEPSIQTIKRLFGESGNLCAFPKCAQPIINGSTVLGKVCHIKGRKPGSARYDAAQSDEDRHGYDNLVLMCGVHHDVIDDDEKSYTVARLHEIKTAHIAKAAKLPEEETDRGALILLSTPVVSVNQSGGITASLVTVNNFSLVGQNDQGKTFTKPSSPVAQPQEGDARFRKSTEPLGMSWNEFVRSRRPQVDVRLAQGKAVWLRLIPVDLSEREFGPLDLKNAATGGNVSLLPLVDFEVEFLIAEDGFGICNRVDHSQEGVTSGVAFAFITGEIWSVDTYLLNLDDNIYVDEIARHLVRRLPDYARFLESLGIKPPYHWVAGIEGVSRMKLAFEGQGSFSQYFGGAICMSNTVAEGGLYDGREDASAALAPFIGKVFKKSGAMCPARYQTRAT
jgi:hypothetical protein